MAKKSRDQELFERLRLAGVRKRVASALSDAADNSHIQRAAKELRVAAEHLEDRVKRAGPAKPKVTPRRKAATKRAATARATATKKAATTRATAAKKGAATRATNARKRSTAAKKGAATRAKAAAKK